MGSELQNLTADTAPASGDILFVVVDPAGTPLARKMTVDNLMKAPNILGADTAPGMDSVLLTVDDPSGTPTPKKTTLGQAYTKYVCIEIVDKDTALTTGNGKKAIHIPTEANGMNLVYCHAFNLTTSSGANPSFAIYNLTDTADMLSVNLTIDAGETGSDTAATAYTINTATDDVATNDIIQVDCDVAGTGTKGVYVTLGFRSP